MFKFKNKIRRKIYFIIPNPRWGTYFLRGIQIKNQLRKIGVDAYTISPKKLSKIKNELVVFVKHITKGLCLTAKNNNNIVIYDLLDGYNQELKFILSEDIIDAIILSTNASKKILSLPENIILKTIYHHIDPRLEKIVNYSNQSKTFNMCYIGNLPELTNNVSYTDRIDKLKIIETNTRHAQRKSWMKKASVYNCHYAVRTDETQKAAKPLIKVGVAAVCKANMIVNRSNAAGELLGDGYPFYTGDDYESVKSVLDYAREVFGSDVWIKGLERMAYLRNKLTVSNIIHDYVEFFHKWD